MKPEEHIVAADYVSDRMSDDARSAADEHLARCAECREAIEAAREKQLESSQVPGRIRRRLVPAPLRVFFPKVAGGIRRLPRFLSRFGIVVGLATYGRHVIATVGERITSLTPSRGFAAELAAASTIVIASGTGIPISTTHTLVGAVLGSTAERLLDRIPSDLLAVRPAAT